MNGHTMVKDHATGLGAGRHTVAGVAALLGSAVLLAGCCEDGKREMERIADKYGQEAFLCCKEIAATDPEAAQICFESLKAWRLAVGQGIIEWYQACLDGNRAWADTVLQGLRQLTAEQAAGGCGGTLTLPDGRHATIGIPFAPEDRLSLSAQVAGPFGLMTPPPFDASGAADDRSSRWTLEGGAFSLTAFGGTVEGTLAGELVLEAVSPTVYRVVDATWTWSVGTLVTTFRLVDPQGESALRLEGTDGMLSLRMSIDAPEGAGLLAPPAAWIELPIRASSEGFSIAASSLPATSVFPGSRGIADWDGDGWVDQSDWIAFVTTEPIESLELRDLTLDGTFDALDLQAFVRAWREQLATQ